LDPRGVILRCASGQDQDFRHVIWVQLCDATLDGVDARGARLHDQLVLGGYFNAALPPIDGLHGRKNVDARDEPFVDERASEWRRILISWERTQNDSDG
jgi:hypothetical protein